MNRFLLLVCFLSWFSKESFGSIIFLTPPLEQLSLALNQRDCSHFANQFSDSSEYYAVAVNGSFPPVTGQSDIEKICEEMLLNQLVVSSPRNTLEYNSTYAAGLSSYLFANLSNPYENPSPVMKMMVAAEEEGSNLLGNMFEFSSTQPVPPHFQETVEQAFYGLGHNCTLLVSQMTDNVTMSETGYPTLHSKKEVHATCLLRVSDMGWSAIDQLYYNELIPNTVAVEFADMAPDAGFRRGGGLFSLTLDEALIYDITIFGGLGGVAE